MFNCTSLMPNSKVDSPKLLHQWELHLLLGNVKKSVELWFLTGLRAAGPATVSYDQVISNCIQVLTHGLQLNCDQEFADVEYRKTALCKLQDDFEWLDRSTQIRDTQRAPCSSNMTTKTTNVKSCMLMENVEKFLQHWTLRNLKANSLCAALQALVAEKDLFQYYYPAPSAFLRNECYATAFFICLSALELNQYTLLSQIDAKLYAPAIGNFAVETKHRRTSSHPSFSISPPKQCSMNLNWAVITKTNKNGNAKTHGSGEEAQIVRRTVPQNTPTFRRVKSLPYLSEKFDKNTTTSSVCRGRRKKLEMFLKPASNNAQSASSSTLNSDCMFFNNTTLKENLSCASSMVSAQSDVSTNSSYTTARHIQLINCDDIKIWTDRSCEGEQIKDGEISAPCAIPERIKHTKSVSPIHNFLALFATPPGYTFWSVQQQQPTQSNQTEVGHDMFSAEAEVPANINSVSTEQLKTTTDSTMKIGSVFDTFIPTCGKKVRTNSQSLFETGISYLDYSQPSTSRSVVNTQYLEKKKANEPISAPPKNCESLMAFLKMSKSSRTNTELEKENAHFRVSEAIISAVEHIKWAHLQAGEKNTNKVKEKKIAEEHIHYAEVHGVEEFADQHSAEVLGITLLSKFNHKKFAKTAEMKWLVTEEDAPQALLPLPEIVTRDPDEHCVPSLTRGTQYWAPPRPQIIFTDHPTPKRKKLVEKQNNRCAGCGMVVSAQFVHSFRYCCYLGKYHCTGCHRNQMSATPAKILQYWDFKYYPVSAFAYRLLEQMYSVPLFNVSDLQPELYVHQRELRTARYKRTQLRFVRDFIKTCRFCTREHQYFEAVPEYLTAEPDLWSMNDFFDVYHKNMQRSIDDLIERCEIHIFHCVLCTARGFLCEYCPKDEIIYPWQTHVHRCDYCGTCFHHKCWKAAGMCVPCLRCQRLKKRQEEAAEEAII